MEEQEIIEQEPTEAEIEEAFLLDPSQILAIHNTLTNIEHHLLENRVEYLENKLKGQR